MLRYFCILLTLPILAPTLCMLPFLCPSLARSSLFIHADLLAFLPDFICNEMELS